MKLKMVRRIGWAGHFHFRAVAFGTKPNGKENFLYVMGIGTYASLKALSRGRRLDEGK